MNLENKGVASKELSNIFRIKIPNLQYMIKLIDRYGIEFVKGRNRYYSPKLKREIIDKVLIEGRSQIEVSLDYALPNQRCFQIGWHNTKKNGYTYCWENRGEHLKRDANPKKNLKKMTELERLQAENEYLETRECYSKKLRELRLRGRKGAEEETGDSRIGNKPALSWSIIKHYVHSPWLLDQVVDQYQVEAVA